MKKKDAEFIWKKLEEWTRCDVMARIGRFDNLEYADYAIRAIKIEDEIREFMFGSSELVVLGRMWGMVEDKRNRKKKNKKKKTLRKTEKRR